MVTFGFTVKVKSPVCSSCCLVMSLTMAASVFEFTLVEGVVAFISNLEGPELDAFSASFTSALKRPFHIDWCLSFSSELVKSPVTLADSVASLTVPKFTDEFETCRKASLHVFPFNTSKTLFANENSPNLVSVLVSVVSGYAPSVVLSGIGGFLVVGDLIDSTVVSVSLSGLRVKKTQHCLSISIQ